VGALVLCCAVLCLCCLAMFGCVRILPSNPPKQKKHSTSVSRWKAHCKRSFALPSPGAVAPKNTTILRAGAMMCSQDKDGAYEMRVWSAESVLRGPHKF
jgi:hypothetical protein